MYLQSIKFLKFFIFFYDLAGFLQGRSRIRFIQTDPGPKTDKSNHKRRASLNI